MTTVTTAWMDTDPEGQVSIFKVDCYSFPYFLYLLSSVWSYPCNTGDNCGYYNNYGTNYNSNLDGISGSFGPMSSLTTNSVTEGPEGCFFRL